jgi:hypothetical protein
MNVRVQPTPSLEKVWLLRALLVLQSPRAVFAALRDDSDETARARSEPITALVILAGIAAVLWTPVAGRLLDDPAIDGLLVAVWAFIGGAFYGIAVYWISGAIVYVAARLAGSSGSYRRARHLVAFAAAPIALSLVVLWPVRLAVYGEDLFRSGGGDAGAGDDVFGALALAFVAWTLTLLLLGLRTVHGWSWRRSLGGFALAAVGLIGLPALLYAL